MPVKNTRAYEEFASEDGVSVLVDRILLRGISKEDLKIDYWMKEFAPSSELRKWFDHDSEKFEAELR